MPMVYRTLNNCYCNITSMRLEKIKFKKKTIAYIHLCLDYGTATDRSQLILSLSKDIKNSSIGYAGFRTKQNLRNYLADAIFNLKNNKEIQKFYFDEKKILRIIKKVIILCHKVIPSEPTKIFIFPTFSTFVHKKMFGTTGYTPWKNTMLIFINSQSRLWKSALSRTIAHEFNHSIVLKYNNWKTLLDSIIFEGLAEYFQEYVIGGKRTRWVKALGVSQSKELFLKLKKYLQSKNPKLYHSVFFGDKKYPLWSGYSVGYHIIRSFIKNNLGVEWKQIIKLSPKEILKRSNF